MRARKARQTDDHLLIDGLKRVDISGTFEQWTTDLMGRKSFAPVCLLISQVPQLENLSFVMDGSVTEFLMTMAAQAKHHALHHGTPTPRALGALRNLTISHFYPLGHFPLGEVGLLLSLLTLQNVSLTGCVGNYNNSHSVPLRRKD